MLSAKHEAAMRNGAKGQKRPADVIGNAVKVMRIAKGGGQEFSPDDGQGCTVARAAGRQGSCRSAKREAARGDREGCCCQTMAEIASRFSTETLPFFASPSSKG